MFRCRDTVYHLTFLILVITLYAKDTEELIVTEGQNVSVRCNATASLDVDLYWTKNSTDSTFQVEGEVLNFTTINRNDSGQYICNSFNRKTGINITTNSVIINVYYEASVKSINVSPSVMHENETYVVTCVFEGNPAPKWQLRLKDFLVAIGEGSGLKKINQTAMCGSTGLVTCKAINSLNNGSAALTQNITVFCSPRPIWLNRYTVRGNVGDFTAMVMNAHGYPYPAFTWSRDDGKPIAHSSIQTNLREISILNVTNIKTSDYANYSLMMNNTYGSYVAHYQLLPSDSPSNNNRNSAYFHFPYIVVVVLSTLTVVCTSG